MQGKEKDGMRRLHELGVPIIKEPHPEDVTRALKDLKEMGGGGRGDTPVSLLSQLAEHDDEDEEDEKQSCHPDYAHKVTFTLTTPTPGEKNGDWGSNKSIIGGIVGPLFLLITDIILKTALKSMWLDANIDDSAAADMSCNLSYSLYTIHWIILWF